MDMSVQLLLRSYVTSALLVEVEVTIEGPARRERRQYFVEYRLLVIRRLNTIDFWTWAICSVLQSFNALQLHGETTVTADLQLEM